jgi:hypothetical protein
MRKVVDLQLNTGGPKEKMEKRLNLGERQIKTDDIKRDCIWNANYCVWIMLERVVAAARDVLLLFWCGDDVEEKQSSKRRCTGGV